MKETIRRAIRTILVEFRERELPSPYPRAIHPPKHHPNVRKAWVLMGMRRSGKTWTVYQEIQRRQQAGLPKETNLYINFEDERLAGFTIDDFQSILDVYFELYPQCISRKDLFFCFDEIHLIVGWEKFIRRLLDTETMQICVTGSSAEMLSKELSTTLGGRAWPQEVFPYSFAEFLEVKGVRGSTDSKTEAHIRYLAHEYLSYGGFPEAVLEPKELHSALIQGYVDAVILRDILQRHSIGNALILQKFFIQILRQLSAPLSINKMHRTFQSQGLSIGKNTLFDYLQFFEDAYAVFSVPIFSLSEQVRQINPKKIYAIDPGIITAYSIKQSFEHSARLENAVFLHLRRSYKNICYYRTKQKKEVDFAVTTPLDNLILVQACVDLSDEETREREMGALEGAAEETGLKEGWVVTENHEEVVQRGNMKIRCIPFWKFALLRDLL